MRKLLSFAVDICAAGFAIALGQATFHSIWAGIGCGLLFGAYGVFSFWSGLNRATK